MAEQGTCRPTNGHFMTIGQKFGTSLQKKKKQNIVKGK